MSDGSATQAGAASTTLEFNRSVRVSASAQRLSSDAGALLLRELDERVGFTRELAARLLDPRDPRFTDYSLAELIRARLFLVALGWGDQNDANLLREDPAFCVAVAEQRGQGAIDRVLASQSTQSRLIDTLALRPNRRELRWALTDLALRVHALTHGGPLTRFTLDLDSTDKETHGEQEGANRNGHYGHRCYHPLVAFVGETGDLVGAWLRRGNVSSQKGAAAFAKGLLDRLDGKLGHLAAVRADAAFATPSLMRMLEKRLVKYVFRLKSNATLARLAQPYLKRPVGRPPKDEVREWHYELQYGAKSWRQKRRVVLVVVDDPNDRFMGMPQPRHFFLVTNFSRVSMPGPRLTDFYRQRGTSEVWIGELKNEVLPSLSSPTLAENAVTFMLGAIAFQLAHTLRAVASKLDQRPNRLTIAGLRARVLKAAVRFTKGKRRLFASVAESAWVLWEALLGWLARPKKLFVRQVT
jgi:hypothetical protein